MTTGPPTVPPKLLKCRSRSLMRLPLASMEVNGLRALVALFRRNSYKFPWKELEPDFSTTLKTPPPVRLYSGAKALVIAWNSETESGEGLTETFSEIPERLIFPSRYQALAPACPPLTDISEPCT